MGYGICVSNVFDIMYINLKLFMLRYFFENSFFYLVKSYYLLYVNLNELKFFLFIIFRYYLIIYVYIGLK